MAITHNWRVFELQGSSSDSTYCTVYTKQEVITSANQVKSFVKLRWRGKGLDAFVKWDNSGTFNALSEVINVANEVYKASLDNSKKYYSTPFNYTIINFLLTYIDNFSPFLWRK